MRIVAEHDRLAFSRPGAPEIRNGVLCMHGGEGGAEERRYQNQMPHELSPMMEWSSDLARE
jgi:hypothetical protein